MMKFNKLLILITLPILTFVLLSTYSHAQERWSPQHLFYGKGGKLTYTPDEDGNTIPDFSHVGYKYGDEPIPDVPVVIELEPVEGDNADHIQMAINSLNIKPLDENGLRGAILLKRGVYNVSRPLQIKAGGIVLRGEGDTDDGTVIVATAKVQHNLLTIGNDAGRVIGTTSKETIIEDYVPVGRKFVVVGNGSKFSEGDLIVLYRPGTTQWIQDIKMDQISYTPEVVQWKPSEYSFYFERLITKVNGDTLFFRNPVIMAMESKYGGGVVYKCSFNRIQNVGVENICFKSYYAHDTDEKHGWNTVVFNSAENCWARNITSWYFGYSCVDIGAKGKLITVENCHSRDMKSIITGSRRYTFVTRGHFTLFKNCTTTEGRHDYVTHARVCGPNVFTNSTASQTHSDIGPHHRWAMGTLYDKILSDGAINVQDRDDSGTGHGWAGANQYFWNCEAASSVCQSPWTSAKNYNFGFIGKKNYGWRPDRPDGEWVGHNMPGIFPSSLYEAQLDERLNGTTVFTMLPFLPQINDTSFMIQFSFPVDVSTAIKQNIKISLSDKSEVDNFSITQNDPYSFVIGSKKFESLSAPSSLIIKTENILSENGEMLQGITSLSFAFPDLRPTVTGVSKDVDNISGSLEASSTKTGFIYLAKYGLKIKRQAELDSLININQARNVLIETADETINISTKGLPGGFYEYYAVDNSGRVSEPSTAWVIVSQKGPVTHIQDIKTSKFKAFQKGEQIVVDPGNSSPYTLKIYSVSGDLLHSFSNLSGIFNFHNNNSGILILQKYSEEGAESIKLVIPTLLH